MRWTDNHCHLSDDRAARAAEVAEANTAGVTRLITVGCDASSSSACIDAAAAFDGVFATVGLHPHDATNGVDSILGLLDAPGVVAVGECGLDYHYDHSPRDVQRAVFAAQIRLAQERSLPLVIHTREAWDDTFAILDAEGMPAHTVFHCFTGGPDEATRSLERGAYLSFSGIITFPSAPELREAAALCPLDRVMVETDAPFLAPVPHRGRKNRPELVAVVGAAVAAAKGVSVDELAEATWANAERFYALS